MKNREISGKTAVITGASRGIGLAIAEVFAENGCNLVLCCLNSIDRLSEISESLKKRYHISVLQYAGDVADPDFIKEMIGSALDFYGKIDILVNNAGVSDRSLLSDLSYDSWHRIINTNLSSIYYTCSAVIPEMVRRREGCIINIASIWGEVGGSCEVAYSACKGGMIAFTKALAKELAPSGISVNAVSPGVIATDMNGCLTEEELSSLADEIPMGRLGRADEVADVVLGIAKAPAFLTAQVIRVDGGML